GEALTVPNMRFDAASRQHLLTANVPVAMDDDTTEKQTSQGHLVLAWSQPMPTPITHLDPPPTAPLQLYSEPRADLLSGSYRLLHLVGRGAAADVYLAQCFVPGAPSTVALKLLAAETIGGSGERFLAEARRQLRVTHPNVVQVHDVGFERVGYVAMEYVEGCTLAKLMDDLVTRDEPLPLPQTVAIVSGIAHALEAALEARDEAGARRPLLHGAVKPSNVLIGRHGAIKLGDFGAPPSAGERRAPEQYAGKPADRRSDVYALGVILHELVTNRRVFAAPPSTVTSWPPLPAPSTLRPELPRALDNVIARATRFGPRGRYANAVELVDELQRATAHAAAHERPSGVLGDWVERARRSS
ncbi:MAG TPA: serine/threonine-protein kinase, partial [Polyangia bacterium]|nr:serine/threonine-protein kinase [Polyangia bacterium]